MSLSLQLISKVQIANLKQSPSPPIQLGGTAVHRASKLGEL